MERGDKYRIYLCGSMVDKASGDDVFVCQRRHGDIVEDSARCCRKPEPTIHPEKS